MNNSNNKNDCDEILKNIQRTLHECNDNKKVFFMKNIIFIENCDNIKKWSEDVSYHVGLKLNINRSIILNKYTIEYNVRNRTLSIK